MRILTDVDLTFDWVPDIPPRHILSGHIPPPRTFPAAGQFPSILHSEEHFPLPPPPSANLPYKAIAVNV